MSLAFFKSIIDQLADDYVISRIGLGLHGDPLIDPLVVERAKYVKSNLPHTSLILNTNGAAYSPSKHKGLVSSIDGLSLHIESLDPKIYDYVMRPLRLERVLKKVEMILQDFGQKVDVVVPIHKLNVSERYSIAEYFLGRGCKPVVFIPITNRCTTNAKFDELAFAPQPTRCRGDILRNLIIDWDGTVFPCCNDYRKELPVGNLTEQTVVQAINSSTRLRFGKELDDGNWADIPTCSKCQWDRGDRILQLERTEREAKARVSELERTEREAKARVSELERALDHRRLELEAVYNSRSWRMTSPLRLLRSCIR
jgi:radical SAM protein with 4Fe4S-binding SPASM domain